MNEIKDSISVRYDGNNLDELIELGGSDILFNDDRDKVVLFHSDTNEYIDIYVGDYLVVSVKGNLYACSSSFFEDMFECTD